MAHYIGIDLGTTHSAIAYMAGKPVFIPIEGKHLIPSVVAFTPAGEVLVGEAARRQALINPANTVVAVKKLMGKTYQEIEPILPFFPYPVKPDENGMPLLNVGGSTFSPQEISAILLQYLREGAEAHLGEPVRECVITVPANFDHLERAATVEACQMAGWTVKRVIREPTAACLAFGFDNPDKDRVALVFDLGGSSVDVSLVALGGGVFEVKSTAGDNFLGGLNFDYAIAGLLADRFYAQERFDLRSDKHLWYRLMEAAEKVKIELSASEVAEAYLPFIVIDGKIRELRIPLTRQEMESACLPLIDHCVELCKKALDLSYTLEGEQHLYRFQVEDIDDLLLVGAATRMPLVRQKVQEYIGKKAVGHIHPEEIVALGAAVEGGILSGKTRDTLLLDTIPHGLGIVSEIPLDYYVEEEKTEPVTELLIIEQHTTVPARRTVTFIAPTGKTELTLKVLEYKDEHRKVLSTISFPLPKQPSKAGKPEFEVTFDIDANYKLRVMVKTDHEMTFDINVSSGLKAETIQQVSDKLRQRQRIKEQYAQLAQYERQGSLTPARGFQIKKLLREIEFRSRAQQTGKTAALWDSLNAIWQKTAQQIYAQLPDDNPAPRNETEFKHSLIAPLKDGILQALPEADNLLDVLELLLIPMPVNTLALLRAAILEARKLFQRGELSLEGYRVELARKRRALLDTLDELRDDPAVSWEQVQDATLSLERWVAERG